MYTIKMASRLSGVSELTIRAWEKRYSALQPQRTDSNRRVYSNDDIEKLTMLNILTQNGYRISDIAGHSVDQLSQLRSATSAAFFQNGLPSRSDLIIDECLDAVREYDSPAISKLLSEAMITIPIIEVIESIVIPLIEKIGELWHEGLLRVSHEHFATSAIKSILAQISSSYIISDNAPVIIIAAPEGQFHELEAILASMIASSEGWRAVYLGPGLPIEEIASAARQLRAGVIHISLVYPEDDAQLLLQLPRLRSLLGAETVIIASGRSARGYEKTLQNIRALITSSARHYRQTLMLVREEVNHNGVQPVTHKA